MGNFPECAQSLTNNASQNSSLPDPKNPVAFLMGHISSNQYSYLLRLRKPFSLKKNTTYTARRPLPKQGRRINSDWPKNWNEQPVQHSNLTLLVLCKTRPLLNIETIGIMCICFVWLNQLSACHGHVQSRVPTHEWNNSVGQPGYLQASLCVSTDYLALPSNQKHHL